MNKKKITGIILAVLLLPQPAPARSQTHRNVVESGHPAGMVKIPAGTMKSFIKRNGQSRVRVASFYLDIYPVTNREFLEFVKANPKWAKSNVSSLFADAHYLEQWEGDFRIGRDEKRIGNCPVTNISWFAAAAYSRWKGKRLPTTAEWEYAGSADRADRGRDGATSLTQYILEWYSRPTPPALPPVGSTFKNRFGIWDMHGLIWEWVFDFNSYMTGGDSRSGSEIERSLFCAAGSLNTVDKEDYAAFMRYGYRGSLEGKYTVRNLGFRCALDAR
jgi:formylglycine-generating enzyme required for sulfatase activity